MANLSKTDQYFIHYLAPTLCGIKPANLFTLAETDFSEMSIRRWKRKLKKQNLCLTAFKSSASRWMIFAYDFVWIRQILSDVLIQAYLRGKGYSNPSDAFETLNELFFRLEQQTGFPHEVGFFLGYPFEDVIEFEEKGGRNCKYCGCWKSYCNPNEAEKCCKKYKNCSLMCKQWFEEGLSVPEIIQKYKQVAEDAA